MRAGIFCKHEVGVRTLDRLLAAGERPVFVIARDCERETMWFHDLEQRCRAEAIEFHPVGRIRDDESVAYVRERRPDLIFSVYYTEIIPPSVLALPPHGIINFHPALLPKYRGPHPVNWAIIKGETKTGLTAHYMDTGVDTGPILLQKEVPITLADTFASVSRRIMDLVPNTVLEVLKGLRRGTLDPVPQDESQASYFPRRTEKDDIVVWHRSAKEIYDLIRGLYYPLPGAWSQLGGRRVVFREASLVTECPQGEGAPGIILAVDTSGTVVCTGDGIILIRRVDIDERQGLEPVDPAYASIFRTGERFYVEV